MDDDMEEAGLYDDLDVDLGGMVTKLEGDKEFLRQQIKTLEDNVERLRSELTAMKETEKRLSRNISELYKTAKTEIERKDRMISDLQIQKDNLLFRRINRANEGKNFNNRGNAKRIKEEVLDENPNKRRKCENEPPAVKCEPGRHSPRSRGSSRSRDFKDRHSSYNKDRHRDSGGGSIRRNRTNEGSDRNRSRYHTKGEDSELNVEHKSDSKPSSDTNKFKHNSKSKQDLTKHTKESSRGKERRRNESTGVSEEQNFRKHDSESVSSERKHKYDSTHKSSVEKENVRSKVNGPINRSSKGLESNTKDLVDDSSSKPAAAGDCSNLPHLKNASKGEDKSGSERKKNQEMKLFSFFGGTPVHVPQTMDCEDHFNFKNAIESKEEKIGPTEKNPSVDELPFEQISTNAFKEQKIRPKGGIVKELENLVSPRHDNLMNYLEIHPKEEKGDEKLVSDDCNNKKVKSKKERNSFSKEEKSKSKGEKKSHTSTTSRSSGTKSSSDGRNRSERESKSGNRHDKPRSKKSDKSSTRKHESKEKREKNVESGSKNLDKLCEERERLKQALETLCGDEEEEESDHKSSSDEANSDSPILPVHTQAQVTFLANVHISPVIKSKKGATVRLVECIEKLGERETSANNVVTSNENPEENHQKNEITSSYVDNTIGSPTSSSTQIITKRTPRLEHIIDKLTAKGPNNSRYDVFAETANDVAHSTLKINDCQLSSTNTTITEENVNSQLGTSKPNLVVPKLPTVNNEIIKNQPDTGDSVGVKPPPLSTGRTESNSNGVNLARPLENSSIESRTTNNNNPILEKSKTDSIDPNISSSSEHMNHSNSTIMLNSTISLNSSSENGSTVRSVFNNRRRRCVVKIVN